MAAPDEAADAALPSTPAAGANTTAASGGAPGVPQPPGLLDPSGFTSWWNSLWGAAGTVAGTAKGAASSPNPLTGSFWEQLGAGFESGALAFVKDIWAIILGPIEVFIGVGFWVIAFFLVFKNDIMTVAGAVARAA